MERIIIIVLILTWPYFLNDFYLIFINCEDLALLWILDAIFFTLIPGISLWVLYRKKLINLADAGFGERLKPSSIIYGILLCVFLLFAIHLNIYPWLRAILPGSLCCSYDFPKSGLIRPLLIIYAAATAAIFEEVICRGIIISKIKEKTVSSAFPIIISAMVFGLMHWCQGPAKIIAMFLWAIIPAIWVIRKGHIGGVIICHFFYGLLIYIKIV